MLSSALRCLRPSCFSLAFSRQLLHHQPHMEHSGSRPVETTIRTKLTQALEPEHLEVLNESHMHAVPPGSESHFRVLVVSPQFESLSLLQRHRLVNEALKEELSTCVHALAIQAKTPQQWSSNPSLAKSPPCLGGSKHDNTMAEKLKCIRADRTVLHRWSLESAEGKTSSSSFMHADDLGHKASEESEQLVSSFGWKNSNTTILWLRPLERALGRSHTGQTHACLTFAVSRRHRGPSECDLCA